MEIIEANQQIIELLKKVQEVPSEVAMHNFSTTDGHYHKTLIIENGEIVETSCYFSERCSLLYYDDYSDSFEKTIELIYRYKKGEKGFRKSCYDTLQFIAKYSPLKLPTIYNLLSKGSMKDFCKLLQMKNLKSPILY